MKLNTKEAIGDFNKYDRKTQNSLMTTLATYAHAMSGEQTKYLKSRVKDWTGRLGGSISPTKSKNGLSWAIGPSDRIQYAWYIEKGAAPSQKSRGNNFAGYGYVQHSVDKYTRSFFRAIKKAVEGR